MKIAVADAIGELQKYMQEVAGSKTPYLGDTWQKRAIVRASNEVHPVLPNGWFTPRDLDVKSNDWLVLPATQGASIYDEEPTKELPDTLLDLRSMSLLVKDSAVRIVYDYGEFSRIKAEMGDAPIGGLPRLVVFQDTHLLRYWHPTPVQTRTRIDYIVRAVDPDANQNIGYFNIAERAQSLVIAKAATKAKLADSDMQAAAAFTNAYKDELATEFQLQQMKNPNDPFMVKTPQTGQ